VAVADKQRNNGGRKDSFRPLLNDMKINKTKES